MVKQLTQCVKRGDIAAIYPEAKKFSVTKFALATEELYQHYNGTVG